MDLVRNKKFLSGIMWLVFGIGIILAGCRLFVPQQEWDKKWGPLVPHTKFPGDCSICHLPERWDKLRDDFQFDHEKETGYRLEGSHAAAACLRCHNDRGPVAVYTARGCSGCHMDPHALSLGMDCERCHSQISWQPIGLVGEHAVTRFPLMGVHAIATCESCHEGAAAGQFQGAPTQCEICHQDDLAMATEPNHMINGWTFDCQRCHQPTASWEGAWVDHNFFPLKGGHALDCTQCHAGGVYTGLSPDCYSCHSANYQAAPDHVANSYSHDCTQCHTINGWIPASINHTFFPLTGPHNLSCVKCHTTGNTQLFSCIDCHEHSQFEADKDHSEVDDYRYNSQACYQCHPNGTD